MASLTDLSISLSIIEIGAIASLGILLFGFYRYKSSKLDSPREREEYLRNLEGKSMQEGQFKINVDNVELDERTGFIYGIKRVLLRPVEGEIYVSVRLGEIQVPEELWEADFMETFFEDRNIIPEYVESEVLSNHTAIVLKIDSAEYDDLKLFLGNFLTFLNSLEEHGVISVYWRPGHKP